MKDERGTMNKKTVPEITKTEPEITTPILLLHPSSFRVHRFYHAYSSHLGGQDEE
jgi:hypothetical protein